MAVERDCTQGEVITLYADQFYAALNYHYGSEDGTLCARIIAGGDNAVASTNFLPHTLFAHKFSLKVRERLGA
jgi:hypothetical protein